MAGRPRNIDDILARRLIVSYFAKRKIGNMQYIFIKVTSVCL